MKLHQTLRASLVFTGAIAAAIIGARCDTEEHQSVDALEERTDEEFTTSLPPQVVEPAPVVDDGCVEEIVRPASLGRSSSVTLPERYHQGQYVLGICIFSTTVDIDGKLKEIRLVRPESIPDDLERSMRDTLESSRYEPATQCGKPVPYNMVVTFGHCPIDETEPNSR